jgi:PTH1 family peptidyl-tRNA hydrolase
MKIIIGLGNKGEEYSWTRHNIGFEFLNFFSEKIKCGFSKKNNLAVWGEKSIKGKKIIILKPMTLMNLSGIAVLDCVKKFKAEIDDIIIIHDDIDLSLFKIKIKKGGGDAGHKGIRSIINELNDDRFVRVRIGVGKPENKNQVVDYVLSKLNEEEKTKFMEKFNIINEFIMNFVFLGYAKAVSKFKDI